MREKRVFEASQHVVKRMQNGQMQEQIAILRRKIGATQAKIMQGLDLPANRLWIRQLNGQIDKLVSQMKRG